MPEIASASPASRARSLTAARVPRRRAAPRLRRTRRPPDPLQACLRQPAAPAPARTQRRRPQAALSCRSGSRTQSACQRRCTVTWAHPAPRPALLAAPRRRAPGPLAVAAQLRAGPPLGHRSPWPRRAHQARLRPSAPPAGLGSRPHPRPRPRTPPQPPPPSQAPSALRSGCRLRPLPDPLAPSPHRAEACRTSAHTAPGRLGTRQRAAWRCAARSRWCPSTPRGRARLPAGVRRSRRRAPHGRAQGRHHARA
mmetsp:Transcript_120207/g.373606  ORF Transcript_120207/g.373606 Transcript_120207/m.373606 type:complete len:253 (-) Transcript_120207:2632-3390(-)